MRVPFLALVAVAGLGACDASGLATAWQLRDVDPARTDPAALRVAVSVPEGVRPRAGEARLVAQVTAEGVRQEFWFALSPVAAGPDAVPIADSWPEADRSVQAYRIAPDDLPEFGRFRAAALTARETGGSGSLSVEAPLCRTGATAPDAIPMRIWLNAAETDGYVLLTRTPDLLAEARAAGEDLPLPQCGH